MKNKIHEKIETGAKSIDLRERGNTRVDILNFKRRGVRYPHRVVEKMYRLFSTNIIYSFQQIYKILNLIYYNTLIKNT